MAEALSKLTLPQTYIASGTDGGGQASILESVLGVKLLEGQKP